MKKITFENAIYSLNKKVKKYIIKNNIPVREINKSGVKWAGYCFITSMDKEIVINNNQSIYSKPFIILHEIGHLKDEEYLACTARGLVNNEQFEKTADAYIYTFCKEHCSLIELFLLKASIEATSKKRIRFNWFQEFVLNYCNLVGVI